MRLRVHSRDISPNDRFVPSGRHLLITHAGVPVDGVQSVTLHCGGRDEPITAVLVVAGVEVDALADLPPAAAAALRLLEEVR